MSAPPPSGPLRLRCEDDGVRLDRFLTAHMTGASRRRTAAIIAAGAVRVNGRRAAKGRMLQRGDAVDVDLTVELAAPPADPTLAVPILYEDHALLALAKPSGMPAVARRASDRGTAANFLLAYAPETAAAGRTPLEAGLAHRLDNGTSGVLLAARAPDAWRSLRAQFHARSVEKEYFAWVDGLTAGSGGCRDPVAHHPRQPRRMVVCRDATQAARWGARPADTRYRALERRGERTLLAVSITTGVRHQIRAHLAAAGHPLCGDVLYGGSPAPRLMLHAAALTVAHPDDGRRLSITCPPPPDFGVAG